jgi:hypothetical protein
MCACVCASNVCTYRLDEDPYGEGDCDPPLTTTAGFRQLKEFLGDMGVMDIATPETVGDDKEGDDDEEGDGDDDGDGDDNNAE